MNMSKALPWMIVIGVAGAAVALWYFSKQTVAQTNLILEVDTSDTMSEETEETLRNILEIYVDGELLVWLGPPYGLAWGYRAGQLAPGDHTLRIVILNPADTSQVLLDITRTVTITEGRRHRVRFSWTGITGESDE